MEQAQDRRARLIQEIRRISSQMCSGDYDQIDLSLIEREAEDLADNFAQVIGSLAEVGFKVSEDSGDIRSISDHLEHISQTTREGVMKVMDHSEAIISDATGIAETLNELEKSIEITPQCQPLLAGVQARVDSLQNNAFTVMTALEFEDINRQRLEKILTRLEELYDNLLKVLVLLKVKGRSEQDPSHFMSDIRKIANPDEDEDRRQGRIDDLLREFGLS